MALDSLDPRTRLIAPADSGAMSNRWLDAIATRVAARPEAVAIAEIDPRGRVVRCVSNAEFERLYLARARILRREFPGGSTVLAAIPSGIDLAAWFAASLAAGTRLVLMHPNCGQGELLATEQKTGAAIVLSTDTAALERNPLPNDSLPVFGRPFGSIVLGSSGTTGLPKLALRESAALDADSAAVASVMGLTLDDAVLCVPPLCHSYGVDILLGTLYSGAALHIMSEFDAAGVAAQIGSGISVLPGLPFLYESLLRIDPRPHPRLRLALSAGSDLSPRIRESFGARWGVPIGQLFGATELGTVAVHRPDDPSFDPLSIGPPLPGVSFRILDPERPSVELAPGQVGQLAVRAPSMLSGYLDGEVPLADGHFLTGDLARADPRGRVTITGRLKFLIDIGGFKVNPLEVEASLREHPSVADCAVAPLDLSDTIRRVRALVVASDPSNPPAKQDLRRFLKARLAANKVPRQIEVVPSLPRSPLGKLLRRELPGGEA